MSKGGCGHECGIITTVSTIKPLGLRLVSRNPLVNIAFNLLDIYQNKLWLSLFGFVTCLAGCTADKGRPILISSRAVG